MAKKPSKNEKLSLYKKKIGYNISTLKNELNSMGYKISNETIKYLILTIGKELERKDKLNKYYFKSEIFALISLMRAMKKVVISPKDINNLISIRIP